MFFFISRTLLGGSWIKVVGALLWFVLSFAALYLPLQSSCFDSIFDSGSDCVQAWLPFVILTVNLLAISFRC
jgi:hypothetical protein